MKQEFSAGGIVIKKQNGSVYILMAQHAEHHGWGFPKGHIGDIHVGESKEDTAIREVKEETGIDAEIISYAIEESYNYTWKGQNRRKTVAYYFMRYISGNFAGKDHEMEAVEWVEVGQVESRLSYTNTKDMFRTVRPELEKIAQSEK